MKTHGTSYYIWTLFFPKEIKEDVFTLYAFVRVPDDIVDSVVLSEDEKKRDISDFCRLFWKHYEWEVEQIGKREREVVIGEWCELFHRYEMPKEWIEAFLDAMIADTKKKSYRTYEELQTYMYGSAEVIGLMMCKIIWYDQAQEKEVFRTARLLWEAMQYTNFLRDINEDYLDLGRLYIPEDRLNESWQTHYLIWEYCKWVKNVSDSDQREKCMMHQVLATKELYAEANAWIKFLDPAWRRAVQVASWLYESILDKILQHNGDVFTKNARTTKREKFCTFISKSCKHGL